MKDAFITNLGSKSTKNYSSMEKEDKNHEPAVKKGVDLVGIVKMLGKRRAEKVK